jgi:hypothetical protein
MMLRFGFALLAVLAVPAAAAAQEDVCGLSLPTVPSESSCTLALATVRAAYAQTGILAAGGNPVPGLESTRGITLGIIPKTTASLRISGARQRLPDLRNASAGDERSAVATAVRLGTATRLFDGVSVGPIGGLGSIDLLLDAAVLPATGQSRDAAAAFGAGARIGIVRETFGTPGVAVSAMVRHVGRQQYGHLCPVPDVSCADSDRGEASFATRDVSGRLTVGKRVGPVGLLGGVGVDRFATSGGRIGYVIAPSLEPINVDADANVHDTRWSAFANVSYALIVGSLVAEGGYMGGGNATRVFDGDVGGYQAGKGTPFGSLVVRISL